MNAQLDLGSGALAFAGGPTTQVFVLLGFPVAHSLSPRLHAAAFEAAGIDAVYTTFEVAPADLDRTLGALRLRMEEGRVGGANVTVPHKRATLPELDALLPAARLAGAVNTIVPRRDVPGGRLQLEGANTDVAGLVAALDDLGSGLAGARVLVLGAGGMARAAVAAALEQGAGEIRVASRDPLAAQDLLDDVAGRWRGRVPPVACTELAGAGAWLGHADVLVQATSLGRAPDDPLPVALESAPAELVVLDAVYAPGTTALVRAARARGLRAADGRGLLLHQGAAAFELWTGGAAPLEPMRQALAD